MIHQDEHGNKYVIMSDGAKVPLVDAGMTIHIYTTIATSGGAAQIVPAVDALAMHQTAHFYWHRKCQELETTIADLREQLANR